MLHYKANAVIKEDSIAINFIYEKKAKWPLNETKTCITTYLSLIYKYNHLDKATSGKLLKGRNSYRLLQKALWRTWILAKQKNLFYILKATWTTIDRTTDKTQQQPKK